VNRLNGSKGKFRHSRLSSRNALQHLESLRGGDREARIRKTAKHFSVDPRRIAGLVAMEWARQNFPGLFQRRARQPKFGPDQLLVELRKYGTFSATAGALDTTALTVRALAMRYGFKRSEDMRTRQVVWTR
jgi:hypothetical protein